MAKGFGCHAPRYVSRTGFGGFELHLFASLNPNYIGVILGLYWEYIGIMEKKMESATL